MPGYDPVSKPSGSDLANLARLAHLLGLANKRIADLEEEVAKAKKEAQGIAERDIPELMDHLGLKTFTTSNGFRIDVKKVIRASIPAGNKERAMRWLDENGHGGLIKRTVQVAFSRDQEQQARALGAELEEQFDSVSTDLKVESATLRAFIREQLEAGQDIPLELFGAFEQRIAEVTVATK